MTEESAFSFEALFSERAPEPVPRQGAANRRKYDFAVAYPDPATLPLTELADSLRDSPGRRGQGPGRLPAPPGLSPAARIRLREAEARQKHCGLAR